MTIQAAATPMTDEHLARIEALTGRVRGQDPLAETVAELKRLRGTEAMLTDLVVMAASLWGGEMSGSEQDYASEALHLAACDLMAANPRLKGAYKGGS